MPIGSGLQPFIGLPAIVGMLPALRRNRCPRWVGLRIYDFWKHPFNQDYLRWGGHNSAAILQNSDCLHLVANVDHTRYQINVTSCWNRRKHVSRHYIAAVGNTSLLEDVDRAGSNIFEVKQNSA
jgi:hypothetical protein